MKDYYRNKVILITGGAGSIGSTLVSQLIELEVDSVIVIDQSELALYNLELSLKKHSKSSKVTFLLSDIRNETHLDIIFESYKPNIVYHTAAYKQLPVLENNPSEGVLTNIFGTINLVKLSNKFNVENFMFVSTDKAVEPISILGRTKRLAELYINNFKSESTNLSIIRFGNIYKSNGSVLELFSKQIREGLPITLTHKDVERYFISIVDACSAVIKACSISNGGETFIIDMGKPEKIINIARQLINDEELDILGELNIEIIGLRQGEKLSEKLIEDNTSLTKTEYDNISYYKPQGNIKISEDNLKGLFIEAKNRNDQLVIKELNRIFKKL